MCVFLRDGSFLSATRSGLRYFSRENEVKWELNGDFHHQLKLSNDERRILALSSESVKHANKEQLQDKVLVISLDGKVLHEVKADYLIREAGLKSLDWVLPSWMRAGTNAVTELSHFNSIYEVPRVTTGRGNSFFREGDLVVNGLGQGIFIISPDLRTLRSHIQLSKKEIHFIHDVQISQRGHLLFFNNHTADSLYEDTYSTVQEIDYPSRKVVFEFMATPKEIFFSRTCGGVQELGPDILLISDNMTGTFFYSRSKNKILSSIRTTHELDRRRVGVQDVKAFDLTEFLSNRKKASF